MKPNERTASRGDLEEDVVSGVVAEVCVLNEQGLHARPAAKLAQEAQKFVADIQLVSGDAQADCKSILDILTLAAAQGCGLELRATGADAQEAVEHLTEFFKRRFGEKR